MYFLLSQQSTNLFASIYFWCYVFILLCYCIAWGIVTKKVVENRGYDENWFWWGFFFSFFAVIVAFSLPREEKTVYKPLNPVSNNIPTVKTKISTDEWKCTCGEINKSYVTTCACGKSKREMQNLSNTKQNQLTKSQLSILNEGGWQCSCGRVNLADTDTCYCGKYRR